MGLFCSALRVRSCANFLNQDKSSLRGVQSETLLLKRFIASENRSPLVTGWPLINICEACCNMQLKNSHIAALCLAACNTSTARRTKLKFKAQTCCRHAPGLPPASWVVSEVTNKTYRTTRTWTRTSTGPTALTLLLFCLIPSP